MLEATSDRLMMIDERSYQIRYIFRFCFILALDMRRYNFCISRARWCVLHARSVRVKSYRMFMKITHIYQNIVEFDARVFPSISCSISSSSIKCVVLNIFHFGVRVCTESIIVIMVFVSVSFHISTSSSCSLSLFLRRWLLFTHPIRHAFSNAKYRWIETEKLFFMTDQKLNKIISLADFEITEKMYASTYQLRIWLICSNWIWKFGGIDVNRPWSRQKTPSLRSLHMLFSLKTKTISGNSWNSNRSKPVE